MPLHVAFLWHMHQPDYVDPALGAALMPWVRLHATKGYLDMIWQVEQHPEFRCTFNLTPILIKQIRQLVDGEARDLWRDLAAVPASELTGPQKTGILEHFFKANWETMVKPHSRYWALLQQRGMRTPVTELARVAGQFSAQDYRDLQVWFNLAWFGYAADELYPQLRDLKQKGRGFTEDDKRVVLDCQQDVLRRLLGHYKAGAERGQIEISTTPFYHPILPLVYDSDFARRCMPGRALPPRFSHPEDARAHLAAAVAQHTEVFGAPPRGIWPSEGSVCPELVPILHDLGLEWFATDEEILWRSLGGQRNRNDLYQAYRVQQGGAEVSAVFRERSLSDFIGFTAARNAPDRAADFLLGHLEQIARHSGEDDPLCAIILDGENCWEHFTDGGRAFLDALYRRISRHDQLRPTGFHAYLQGHPPRRALSQLQTGSWINADFDIWIGDPEENRAWELLGKTRAFLQGKADRHEITEEQHRRALESIYAAEGSDWFWWYGGDFVTDNDLLFDQLFRSHLQNVYRICGVPVPDELQMRICRSEMHDQEYQPMAALISPQIDGAVTSFYEWTGAAVYETDKGMSAMARTTRPVEAVLFGTDSDTFYLRVNLRADVALTGKTGLRITVTEPQLTVVEIPQLRVGELDCYVLNITTAGCKAVLGQILEIAIPFRVLHWKPGVEAGFYLQLNRDGVVLERIPSAREIRFRIPDDRFVAENWQV